VRGAGVEPARFYPPDPKCQMEGTKGYAEGTRGGLLSAATDERIREMDTISMCPRGLQGAASSSEPGAVRATSRPPEGAQEARPANALVAEIDPHVSHDAWHQPQHRGTAQGCAWSVSVRGNLPHSYMITSPHAHSVARCLIDGMSADSRVARSIGAGAAHRSHRHYDDLRFNGVSLHR